MILCPSTHGVALLGSIGTPLMSDEYDFDNQQADLYSGLLYGAAGLIAVVVFVVAKPLGIKFGERRILLAGLLLCCVAFVIYLPWGPKPVRKRALHDYDASPLYSHVSHHRCNVDRSSNRR